MNFAKDHTFLFAVSAKGSFRDVHELSPAELGQFFQQARATEKIVRSCLAESIKN